MRPKHLSLVTCTVERWENAGSLLLSPIEGSPHCVCITLLQQMCLFPHSGMASLLNGREEDFIQDHRDRYRYHQWMENH